jgi:hypothetical protein
MSVFCNFEQSKTDVGFGLTLNTIDCLIVEKIIIYII